MLDSIYSQAATRQLFPLSTQNRTTTEKTSTVEMQSQGLGKGEHKHDEAKFHPNHYQH